MITKIKDIKANIGLIIAALGVAVIVALVAIAICYAGNDSLVMR